MTTSTTWIQGYHLRSLGENEGWNHNMPIHTITSTLVHCKKQQTHLYRLKIVTASLDKHQESYMSIIIYYLISFDFIFQSKIMCWTLMETSYCINIPDTWLLFKSLLVGQSHFQELRHSDMPMVRVNPPYKVGLCATKHSLEGIYRLCMFESYGLLRFLHSTEEPS